MRSSVFILSPDCWVNLIFQPLLNVDELIFMQRTCKMFGFHERLKLLIKQRITEVFQNVPQIYWNKREHVKNWSISPLYYFKFGLAYERPDQDEYFLTFFSTRERLINQFELDFVPNLSKFTSEYTNIQVVSQTCIVYTDGICTISVEGINDYVLPRIVSELMMKVFFSFKNNRYGYKTKVIKQNNCKTGLDNCSFFILDLINNEFAFKKLRTICETYNGIRPCVYYCLKDYNLYLIVE